MVTTLIDDINQKIKGIKKLRIDFLTQQEKKEISQIVNTKTRYFVNYYNENKEDIEKLKILAINDQDCANIKDYIRYNEQVNEIKAIFTNIKQRVNKEEQKLAQLLEENVLNIMEGLIEGIDYWEDWKKIQKEVQLQSLEKYLVNNLENHSKLNQRIIGRLERKKKYKKEESEEEETIYYEIDKPEELIENIKDGKLVETTIEVIEKGEQDANIHIKAIGISEKKNKEIAEELREEISGKTGLLNKANKIIEKKDERIKKLEEELEAKTKLLDGANKKIEKKDEKLKEAEENIKNKDNIIENLTNKLYLAIRNLPSLPKKTNKLKLLGTKIKTKSRQLIEKTKQQSQELIARIEVKTN